MVLRAKPETFAAVARAAQPGDWIVLARGYYGDVALPKADHAEPVAIDASQSRARTLIIRATAGWTWLGGTIDTPPAAYRGVLIDGAQRIEIAGVYLTGGLTGAAVIGSQDIMLRGNVVTGMQGDGFNVVASQRVRIIGNTLTDFRPGEAVWRDGVLVKDAPHSDAIQLWSLSGREPTSDVLILGNRIEGRTQGITHFWHAAQGRPKVERVTVERNEVAVASWWGIGLRDTPGAVVRGNVVRTLANERGLQARIWTDADAVVEGNVVDGVLD
jgi:nitrous oxidase accessory protein NosD